MTDEILKNLNSCNLVQLVERMEFCIWMYCRNGIQLKMMFVTFLKLF